VLLKTTAAMLAETKAMRSEQFKLNAPMLGELRAIHFEQKRDRALEAGLRQLERLKHQKRPLPSKGLGAVELVEKSGGAKA
jgi:hypothetical protein